MSDDFLQIEREILNELSHLGSESYLNPQKGKIFSALLMYPEGVTQDKIINLTELSRTIVSDRLSDLKTSNLIEIKKRAKERKKIYQSAIPLESAFRLYLINILKNFKENAQFSNEILNELNKFPFEEQKCPAVKHFIQYMQIFQDQNHFVITNFENYLKNQINPPHVSENDRIQFLMKYLATLNHFLDQQPDPDIKPNLLNDIDIRNRLDQIKKSYIEKFRNLMEKSDKNSLFPAIVNFLYIEDKSPTQERILSMLEIPRSTLSDALKKVENDRLIRSIRWPQDKKIHYFNRIPRNLLLSAKFFSMLRELMGTLNLLSQYLKKVPKNHENSQNVFRYLEQAIREYNSMVDFLIFIELELNATFKLNLI